jgi:hypothetical protein
MGWVGHERRARSEHVARAASDAVPTLPKVLSVDQKDNLRLALHWDGRRPAYLDGEAADHDHHSARCLRQLRQLHTWTRSSLGREVT